jgi:hypothetical protein
MQLVLGLQGLPGAEIGLVKTIMRLSSTLHAEWVVSEAGPCDVLLLDSSADMQPGSASVVLPVLPRGQAGQASALTRPIRAEALIELLNDAGIRSTAGRRPAAPAAAPGAHDLARLRRWPPFALLRDRPDHLQLATLLSRHALSASRLSAAAARPLAECEAFLRELDAHQLLAWQPAERVAEHTPQVHTQQAVRPQPRRGLLTTLRNKLGIGRIRA